MFSLRRSLTGVLSLTILLAAMGGCSSPPPPARSHAEIVLEAEKVGLRELWHHRMPLIGNDQWVKVWRVGDSIYATTKHSHLLRFTASSGTLAWNVELGNPEFPIYRPADIPESDYVLVISKGKGFWLHKKTGDIVRQSVLSFAATTDPVVVGNCFLVGSVEHFRAVYLDFLGQKWNTPAPGDAFAVRPALEGETVAISSDAGRLWRVSANTGEWSWKDRTIGTGSRVVGGLAADSRAVYVPCIDGKVFAFDLHNGTNLWTRQLQGVRLDRDLSCARSDLLVPATGQGLYNLNAARGDVKWFVPGMTEIGTMIRGRVWVSDNDGNLKSISLDTGEVLAGANLGGTIITNNVDQLVITVSPTGELTAYSASR